MTLFYIVAFILMLLNFWFFTYFGYKFNLFVGLLVVGATAWNLI